jgi:hypothetical protein
MPKHVYYDRCESGDCGGTCHFCTLAVCKTCSLYEGALTTDCPGHYVTYEQSDEIYKGKIDFRDNEGWVNKKNPTNQMWLYGRYIRFHGRDIDFANGNDIGLEHFYEIKESWIKEGFNLEKLKPKNCERSSFFNLRSKK